MSYIQGSLENILKSCAHLKSARTFYKYEGLSQSFLSFDLNDSGCDFGFYYICNDSHVTFKEVVTFKTLQGYRLMPPHQGRVA